MASTGEIPEQEYLSALARQVAELRGEARRLNRRLRNARAAIQAIEDELVSLGERIQSRLAELPRNRGR
jgi:predicted  nucleic acid-binding Zn-ribbon protein